MGSICLYSFPAEKIHIRKGKWNLCSIKKRPARNAYLFKLLVSLHPIQSSTCLMPLDVFAIFCKWISAWHICDWSSVALGVFSRRLRVARRTDCEMLMENKLDGAHVRGQISSIFGLGHRPSCVIERTSDGRRTLTHQSCSGPFPEIAHYTWGYNRLATIILRIFIWSLIKAYF